MNDAEQETILIIHPDRAASLSIQCALENAGFRIVEAARGEHILDLLGEVNPCLVLLDWDQAGQSALGLVYEIRKSAYFSNIPLILTARELSCDELVLALEAGTDLCLEGSPAPNELVARVRALLRRVRTRQPHSFRI